MNPFELFKLLSTVENRDEFIKILKANRVQFSDYVPDTEEVTE